MKVQAAITLENSRQRQPAQIQWHVMRRSLLEHLNDWRRSAAMGARAEASLGPLTKAEFVLIYDPPDSRPPT